MPPSLRPLAKAACTPVGYARKHWYSCEKFARDCTKVVAALAVLAASSFICPCGAEDPSAEMTNRLPTATEVFNLRSECAALGRKILDDNVVGPALYQSQVSHYVPKSNRCYVELTVQTADVTKQPHKTYIYLYDGQTGEMLASLRYEGEDHKSGIVFDSHHEATTHANGYYDDTKAYIDALMDEGPR